MKLLFKKVITPLIVFCLAITPFNISNIDAEATSIYGDVNNSGSVNIADVVKLNGYLYGDYPTSSINLKNADVDQNTVIDINDIEIIENYVAEIISSLPYNETNNPFNYNSYSIPYDETRRYCKYVVSEAENNPTYTPVEYNIFRASSVSTVSEGNDNRHIDNSYNAKCIVRLCGEGTGFIVGDHVIATAAHCLYRNSAIDPPPIWIYDEDGTTFLRALYPKEIHIPYGYVVNSDAEYYDYGLIYVDEDLSQYGKMPLGIATNRFRVTEQPVSVSGFPFQVVNTNFNTYRYFGAGVIKTTTDDTMLRYSSYVSSGDSGGPVYIEYSLLNNTFRSAIGINVDTGTVQEGNVGVKFTLPVLRFYNNNPNIPN